MKLNFNYGIDGVKLQNTPNTLYRYKTKEAVLYRLFTKIL